MKKKKSKKQKRLNKAVSSEDFLTIEHFKVKATAYTTAYRYRKTHHEFFEFQVRAVSAKLWALQARKVVQHEL